MDNLRSVSPPVVLSVFCIQSVGGSDDIHPTFASPESQNDRRPSWLQPRFTTLFSAWLMVENVRGMNCRVRPPFERAWIWISAEVPSTLKITSPPSSSCLFPMVESYSIYT